MLFVVILMAIMGWLAGVWLPWQLLLVSYLWIAVVVNGIRGLPAIGATLLVCVFVLASSLVGFVVGNATLADIGRFIKFLFTGG